ncbi:MAG: hypothetical protein COA79_26125 [Planctomycetota bacterium]|nr:MAG: hypothetical protein COA79_26125 [Planctomycetota bacterium]
MSIGDEEELRRLSKFEDLLGGKIEDFIPVNEEDKVELENLLNMDEIERVDLLIHSAQGIIDNGGLYYFFESDFPGRPPYQLFINTYKEIGDFKSAECLENAVNAFPFNEPHLHVDKRLEYLSLTHDQGTFEEIFSDTICGNEAVWDKLNEYIENVDIGLINIILKNKIFRWGKTWCEDSFTKTGYFFLRIHNLFKLKIDDSIDEIPSAKVEYSSLQEDKDTYFLKESGLKFNGMAFIYYGDKTPKLKSIMLNGKKEGIETTWHNNGTKASETTYVNGEKIGFDQSWYEDGSPEYKTVMTFMLNNKYTLFSRWFKNGKKQSEFRLKNNQREGAWIFWHDNGKKERHEIWKKGNCISSKEWNSDGSVKEN